MLKLILIVEDNPEIGEVMKELFEIEGYEVALAVHGGAALEFLERGSRQPGLILLDLTMPVMDGWVFRERQLADPRWASIPVVILTATDIELRKIDAKAILRKPPKVQHLLETVQLHCA